MKTVTTTIASDSRIQGLVGFAYGMAKFVGDYESLKQELEDKDVMTILTEETPRDEGGLMVMFELSDLELGAGSEEYEELSDAWSEWENNANLKDVHQPRWDSFIETFQRLSGEQCSKFLAYFPNPKICVGFTVGVSFLYTGVDMSD